MNFPFDKSTFNKNYALIFNVLKYVFSGGFLLFASAFFLPANSITIPDVILPISCAYLITSVVGFPLVLVLKEGFKRLISSSELKIEENTIVYNKLTDDLWTVVGHIEEHHVYEVNTIDSVKVTRFSYEISGNIEKTVINNGRVLSKENVKRIKIPNAYLGMEKIVNYGK